MPECSFAQQNTDFGLRPETALETIASHIGASINQAKRDDALRESEEHFRRTFDQSPVGAAVVSLDMIIERVNTKLCQITGYSEEEILGMSLADIVHREDFKEDIKDVQRLIGGHIDYYEREERWIRKDGQTEWISISVRLMRDISGQPLHFLPMIQNITDRKRIEEALRLSHERFLTVLDSIDATIYVVDMETYEILFMNQHMIQYYGSDNDR